MRDMLDKWSRTGEFRDVPQDKFLKVMLAAQKDGDTAETALDLCYRRYRDSPPADLIKVLLKTPIALLSHSGYWTDVALPYLGKHKISAKRDYSILLQAARADCLPEIFDKLKARHAPEAWEALVLAVRDADGRSLLEIRQGLRECRDHFDEASVKRIHCLVKTRVPKNLAWRIAAVLPDDLSVATLWMSLWNEDQKTDVAASLLENMTMYAGPPVGTDYWQARLDETLTARHEATDPVKSWLDLYRASLHYKIGEKLWQRGNEKFKIGLVETAAEKEEFDNLEAWLEDTETMIAGKDKLLHNMRTDREPWGRWKIGHVWHARLTKALYESRAFKSVEVEYEMSGRDSRGDILLEDEHGKDIHIEAWGGMTEPSHARIRMFLTGEQFDINKMGRRGDEDGYFKWEYINWKINCKVKQLPKTGRNFVIAHSPDEFPWQSMEGVDLKDNTCVIQVVLPREARVWCGDRECMGATARLISKSLGLAYHPIDGGW